MKSLLPTKSVNIVVLRPLLNQQSKADELCFPPPSSFLVFDFQGEGIIHKSRCVEIQMWIYLINSCTNLVPTCLAAHKIILGFLVLLRRRRWQASS